MSLCISAIKHFVYNTDYEPGRPHDPDYVPEPIYPEYIPLEDEHKFLVEEQPLPLVDSPTAESPRYVAESDPEEDPKEYKDDETEDGPVDYPIDGGEDRDDDDGGSHGDDADDEDEDEEDEDEEEEEEEHLAPVDFVVVVPTIELVFPPERTEPVTPPPSTDITTTGARIIVRIQASISLPPEAEVERLLAMPTPPSSQLISLSPPSAGEFSACETLRIASTQALVDAVTAALPSPPLLPLLPSLYIPLPVDHRDNIPKSKRPPRKRSCLFALDPSTLDVEERRRRIIEVGYGMMDTWVDPAEAVPEIAPMTVGKETVLIMEEEDYASREAWAHAIRLSQAVHYELQTHPEMAELRETDRRRQTQMIETLRVMRDMRREMGDMQAELLALREQQRRARQPTPDARVPDHQDASRDADSHI
ncbi:hypothetical protein Tco_0982147 [Tanacetum coccineum]